MIALTRPYRRFYGAVALALSLVGTLSSAQWLFSPAIKVNDSVITQFEINQRAQFLRLLRAPGNPETTARQQLIEDRLKAEVAIGADIVATPDQVRAGMDEFAQRANLTREEFVSALADNGIQFETFRDFAEIGIVWREFVRRRFLGQARPSEAQIDRAIGGGNAGSSSIRVLLSEIVIPVTPQTQEQVQAEAERISQIRSISAFSAEAEQFSAAETRTRGGRMDWMPVSDLPPNLQPVILELSPGEVTAPLVLPQAVALFQLRDIGETAVSAPTIAAIEYATYYIPGGRTSEALSRAAQIQARIDTCDDLYGIAQGQPPEVLDREALPPSELPQDFAVELAKLDDNEVSTALTRNNGQTLVFLMMCGRMAAIGDGTSREDVANALTQQNLRTLADGYLQQLQAEALIVEQ